MRRKWCELTFYSFENKSPKITRVGNLNYGLRHYKQHSVTFPLNYRRMLFVQAGSRSEDL